MRASERSKRRAHASNVIILAFCFEGPNHSNSGRMSLNNTVTGVCTSFPNALPRVFGHETMAILPMPRRPLLALALHTLPLHRIEVLIIVYC